jgi:hypothetical protein
VLLRLRHALPVESVALLLRPEADGRELSGTVRLERVDGTPYLDFRHRVVRAWQQPVEAVLAGGLATLPLAPLADVDAAELPAVVRRMGERFRSEAAPTEAGTLWTATYWLLGLRYSAEFAGQLLHGVRAMIESTTYQATLAEGEAKGRFEEAKRILLRLGTKRFGPPDARVQAALEAVGNVEGVERLTDRVLDATGWDELLAVN